MNGGIGRKLGATSIVALLALAGMMVGRMSIAWAVTIAMPVQTLSSGEWAPPSAEPSGAAWIDTGEYLFVVDTNVNNPNANGWRVDIHTGNATSRATGVDEPTGIDYDPVSNTLFISQDDGHMFVITDFDTPDEDLIEIDVSEESFDTEDPAYNRNNGRLYWVDGVEDSLFELDPGDGIWGNSDDEIIGFSLDPLSMDADWEALAWDPRTGNLLIGNSNPEAPEIYETDTQGAHVNTIDVNGVNGLSVISGMGVAPASYQDTELSLWLTDRDTSSLYEISFDGTVPPPTTSTTTTTTTTPSTTTTTTPPTTTTTIGTTTTTSTGTTTTTTIPGGTTTTTTTTLPTNPPPPPPDPEDPFVDDNGSVFESSIEWLAAEGITQGCNPPANTRFCPDARVTRGQMATFLVRAFHYTDNGGGDLFTDDNGSVFQNAIDKLGTAGITRGCNPPANTRFCPDDLVTRGQMAAFLVRAFDYTDAGGGDWFTDDDDSVFETAIDRLKTAGVTQGCNPPTNSRYCPDDFVTRGQMAAFLKRAFGE